MSNKTYTGINIQYPISRQILSGEKSIETRTYPIPEKFVGLPLAIIETPGKLGKFKSRIIGIIIFSECFKYQSEKKFYLDRDKHLVGPDSIWAWKSDKGKWGWKIKNVRALKKEIPLKKRSGIKYCKDVQIS